MKVDLQFDEFVPDTFAGDGLEYIEMPIARRVFVMLLGVALLVALVVLGRVGFLNLGRGSFYAGRSSANVNREVALPAYRGIIIDRFGSVIAKNAETFSVFVSIAEFIKDRQAYERDSQKLADALSVPVNELRQIIEQFDFEKQASLPVARNITTEVAIAVRSLELASVRVENDYRREYPYGASMSHILGYTGLSEKQNLVEGKTGLEKFYDQELRGTDGAYAFYKDAAGEVIDERVVVEPVAGSRMETTIDGGFQEYFYNRLSAGIRALGVSAGVGLAMNPQNGEILSLVSLPSFDNNVFVTPGESNKRAALFTDKSRPLFNRAVSGSYNPGSTIKPLVALAALKEKVVDPTFQIYSKGYIELPNPYNPDQPSRFVDWKAHGWVDVQSALARSSNVYFYEIGGGFEGLKGLGIERLKQYWQEFGLGQPTGIDMNFEHPGFLPDPDEKEKRTNTPWRIGDTYNVSIGQGDLLVSPLQLLNFISSIAHSGKMYEPHLVKRIIQVNGAQKEIEPKLRFDYSDWESELSEVRAGMEDAVRRDYGTAKLLNDLPFSVAAKTGSAQIQNNTKTNAFFVGYAPAQDPQIAILVLVENAKEGSLNAVPIAKDVLNWYYENRMK